MVTDCMRVRVGVKVRGLLAVVYCMILGHVELQIVLHNTGTVCAADTRSLALRYTRLVQKRRTRPDLGGNFLCDPCFYLMTILVIRYSVSLNYVIMRGIG